MNGGTGYFVTKDPAFALLADSAGLYEIPSVTDWFYEGGGIDIARDLYAQYGTYYLGPVLWGAESIRQNAAAQYQGLRGHQDACARGHGGGDLAQARRRRLRCRHRGLHRARARQGRERPTGGPSA